MKSPLSRVIITIFAGYLLILLILSVSDWLQQEYPKPPHIEPNPARIQHTYDHRQAEAALKRFSGLPESEKKAIKQSLKKSLIPVARWRKLFNLSACHILCLGEHHEESTRAFLANHFFPQISTDVLMLEATPKELKRLLKKMNSGRPYFPMLEADILNVLRSAITRNSNIEIVGIEETDLQAQNNNHTTGGREKSIAQNFWKDFHPGKRHVILFGALHCTNETGWLYARLLNQASPTLQRDMINVLVIGEHQDGPLEAFVFFLDEIGVEKDSFVIADTGRLHSLIYEWFPRLARQTLRRYETVIVFRG